MPNIRKSFSFRDGVQVDDDDFIVRGNLVGIGTTIPAEKLDVRGNISVTGLVTATELNVTGVSTFAEVKLGAGIKMNASGVITATSFKGDGSTLSNLPTSQWTDVNIGVGVTSIYNTGNVGVGTTDPVYQFQVGKNPNSAGVGINSTGSIKASGIITATSFVGAIAGPVVGNVTGNVTGDLTGDVTAAAIGSTDLNISGVSTFAGAIDANGNLDVDGETELDNLNVSGIATFKGDVQFHGATGITSVFWDHAADPVALHFKDQAKLKFGDGGDLQISHTGDVSLIRDIRAGVAATLAIGADHLILRNKDGNENYLEATDNGSVKIYHDFFPRLETTGLGVTVTGSQLEVFSDGGNKAQIAIGQSIGVGNSTTVLKFENKSFEILNNETGNLTMYLHKGAVGVNTGSFDWVYGQTNQQLMTLTYGGSLGLGVAAPTNTLHVVGTSTVTSNAWVGGNLSVSGTITGTINYPSVITGTNLNNTSGLSTFTNVRAAKIGINISSPRTELDVFSGTGIFQGVGIGTTNPIATLEVQDGVASFDKVGIGTTAMHLITNVNTGDIQFHNRKLVTFDQGITVGTNSAGSRLGVGTHAPRCAVDFSDAGSGAIGAAAGFMMIPRVSSTVRDNFSVSAAPGSVIYNTTTNKMQCHNGTAWQDLF